MSYPEQGPAWAYNEGALDTLDGPIGPVSDIKEDAPLQFAALFARSKPQNGHVALSQLGAIIERASIANDKSAEILELSADSSTQLVSERRFYWALAHASALQSNPSHDIVAGSLPSPIVELELSDEVHGDSASHLSGKDGGSAAVSNIITGTGVGGGGGSSSSSSSRNGPLEYKPTADRTLRVTVMTANAGSFLSKHAVYSVDGTWNSKPVRVLRRYRDFAQLSSLLTHKYAFRAIPPMPPKRLAMNGRFLIGEPQETFLDRRAAGLTRFLNLVVQHPVLAKDALVDAFLFIETQFDPKLIVSDGPDASFSSSSGGDEDELAGRTASPLFISQWNPEKLEEWKSIETAAHEYATQVSSLCRLLEQHIKRIESEQRDAEVLGRNFIAMSRFLAPLYPDLQDDLPDIQPRLENVAQFADTRVAQLTSDRERLQQEPLEEIKLYRDMLISITNLLSRAKALGKNTIPEQQKRIETTQRKLVAQSTKEDVKEEDLHKLRQTIQQAQASIRDQTNRDWLIKMVVSQELHMVQTMQYQISKILRAFSSFLADSSTKYADTVAQMADTACSAPLNI